MDNAKLNILAEEVLTQLELKETTLLSWGFLGGVLLPSLEVEKILQNPPSTWIDELWQELQYQGVTVNLVIENLLARKLIFGSRKKGRTRYAETCKLLYLLKQRFSIKDWQSAPNLVSNIKFLPKFRKHPKRDKQWQQVKEELTAKKATTPFTTKVLTALLDEGTINLAAFQVESLNHLLQAITQNRDGGMIIAAGTGSGKTKAFYLPVFAYICESIRNNPRFYTKVLALYPRNELLKDQLKEALVEAGKLKDLLKSSNRRPVTVGAYYGDVPPDAAQVKQSNFYQWKEHSQGYICPFLSCPQCNDELVWLTQDHQREVDNNKHDTVGEHERLHCLNSDCNLVLDQNDIILTRKHMAKSPPDILFTTTEILNRKLCDSSDQHIFGLGTFKPPKFVFLDEVHIHNGVNGAHVAYLLRRWRNLIRIHSRNSGVHFVGLSATLNNPRFFFANLTGASEKHVRYITPTEEDLTEEGLEYNLVVRGDPISATALLSTTVQTAMLLGRMLDPLNNKVSKGAWGTKIFGFTDKLDVINRWYHIQQDAETRKILSQYRDEKYRDKNGKPIDPATIQMQRTTGQVWRAVQQIDKSSLKKPLTLAITSSQVRGVDPKAKLVIATSTLEVGYNDSEVGAVIQHKAPRDRASFLQRKGRAGRVRRMRPWTIIITSAYGRDRWVYEHPEQIFDPVLPELNLPIKNSYIQHIQASFAVMEWLALKLRNQGYKHANLWQILTPNNRAKHQKEKRYIHSILQQVLAGNYKDLANFIQRALQLDQLTLDLVMWFPPRSIMLNLIPTLAAQVKTNWSQFVLDDYPLAGFIPRTLFSGLETNDIQVIVPFRHKPENMVLRQGMVEFAPGNVSKRYANIKYISDAHWIPVPLTGENSIKLEDKALKGKILVKQLDVVDTGSEEITVCLPQQYHLEKIPAEISDHATARLKWKLNVRPNGEEWSGKPAGKTIKFKPNSPLQHVLSSIDVLASDNNNGVIYTRYAKQVEAEIKLKKGETQRKEFDFLFNGQPAALGLQVNADTIAAQYQKQDFSLLVKHPNWSKLLQQLRAPFYFYQLKNDAFLCERISVFAIEWLCQISMSTVVAVNISKQVDLKTGVDIYRKHLKKYSERTLKAIFKTSAASVSGQDQEEINRLQKKLLECIDTPEIIGRFLEGLKLLYADITAGKEFWDWLDKRYAASVAAAFKTAADAILPDVNTEDILVDIKDGWIWLSEPECGGVGIISKIASRMQNYPGKFEQLFIKAAGFCKRNKLAKELDEVLLNIDDHLLKTAFKDVRSAKTIDEQKEALVALQQSLSKIGIIPGRELVVAIRAKLLNSNSDENTDQLAKLLHRRWQEEENRLQCAIDTRIFTVAAIQLEDFKDQINNILGKLSPGGIAEIDESNRFILVESMLWSGCLESCSDCLQLYNPFTGYEAPSRLLLNSFMKLNYTEIDYRTPAWPEIFVKTLQEGKKARIKVKYADINSCRRELLNIIQKPVEIGFELLYSFIEGIYSSGSEWLIDIGIREVFYD